MDKMVENIEEDFELWKKWLENAATPELEVKMTEASVQRNLVSDVKKEAVSGGKPRERKEKETSSH